MPHSMIMNGVGSAANGTHGNKYDLFQKNKTFNFGKNPDGSQGTSLGQQAQAAPSNGVPSA